MFIVWYYTQALECQVSKLEKSSIYIRLMEQVKAIHLGMGLRSSHTINCQLSIKFVPSQKL